MLYEGARRYFQSQPTSEAVAAPSAEVPSQAPGPLPGQKKYLQGRAKELGLSQNGTKADIYARLQEHEGGLVGRRVRGKRSAPVTAGDVVEIDPVTEAQGVVMQSNPLMQLSQPQPDPFEEALGRLQSFGSLA